MTSHTTLLSLNLTNLNFKKHSDIQKVIDGCFACFSRFNLAHSDLNPPEISRHGGFMHQLLSKETGNLVLIRGHSTGLLTIDIHEFVTNSNEKMFNEKVIKEIGEFLQVRLNAEKVKNLPAIRRGEELEVYYPTVDGRLIEVDFKEKVFEAKSKYQNILIAKSEQLGNVLILDGDLNMGESDLIYSHTLMQKGKISYQNKKCLILGGGDGSLLWELLLENPSHVTLVDIDEEVIKASNKFLTKLNKNILNNYKAHNYEIIIEDAMLYLKGCLDRSLLFDLVLYDITAIPVTQDNLQEWEFLIDSIKLSLLVLEEGGKFLCHSTALLSKISLEKFDKILKSLEPKVNFLKHEAFIPSFHEVSVFYEIWKN